MKRATPVAVVALLVGAVIVSLGARSLHAQQPAVTRTPLMQKDLEGVDGKEVVMFLAEIAPGAQSGRHYHPGTEIAYVLSGTGVMEIDGQAPSELKEGARALLTPKLIHNARNTGSTPLRILVVMVHPKGEPSVVPVTQDKLGKVTFPTSCTAEPVQRQRWPGMSLLS
jgi:quercetin dioxygenase-like cupin family protein